MRIPSIRSFAAASAAMVAASASAEVTFYDVLKNVQYTQTSNAQPSTPVSWDFAARIFTNVDNDVTAGTVAFPGGSRNLTPNGPRLTRYFQPGFASEAALNAAYPTGEYVFTATAGTLAGQTGSLMVPDAVRPNEVPYLTGTSYDELQSAVEGQPVTVTWDPYTVPSPVTHELVFFQLFKDNVLLHEVSGVNGSFTSYTIDGAELVAGSSYRYSLFFDPRFQVAKAGFNGTASSIVDFDSITSGTFSVEAVPEPGSIAALGVGVAAILRRRKKA
ncbi:PEP-CTERM sorting domain-containing protein [bacterium]|nr:MAG: PEP-CTERM sorting domain-containing protein [bacterium]